MVIARKLIQICNYYWLCARRSLYPRKEATTKVVIIFILNLRSIFNVTYVWGHLVSITAQLCPKTWSPTRLGAEGSDYPQPTFSIVTGGSAASVNPTLLIKATSEATVTWWERRLSGNIKAWLSDIIASFWRWSKAEQVLDVWLLLAVRSWIARVAEARYPELHCYQEGPHYWEC